MLLKRIYPIIAILLLVRCDLAIDKNGIEDANGQKANEDTIRYSRYFSENIHDHLLYESMIKIVGHDTTNVKRFGPYKAYMDRKLYASGNFINDSTVGLVSYFDTLTGALLEQKSYTYDLSNNDYGLTEIIKFKNGLVDTAHSDFIKLLPKHDTIYLDELDDKLDLTVDDHFHQELIRLDYVIYLYHGYEPRIISEGSTDLQNGFRISLIKDSLMIPSEIKIMMKGKFRHTDSTFLQLRFTRGKYIR